MDDKEFRICLEHKVKCWKRPWGKWSHKTDSGWCNKNFDETTANEGFIDKPYPNEKREKLDDGTPVDWDLIARGKIRSLFLQAHIQKNGLVGLTDEEETTLYALVSIAMGDNTK